MKTEMATGLTSTAVYNPEMAESHMHISAPQRERDVTPTLPPTKKPTACQNLTQTVLVRLPVKLKTMVN